MKCRKCGYALWNLNKPFCPECGERFDVQSYWFEPGTVVFKCPYCGRRHEGRTARGLPFDAGRCEGCGQILAVEQMPVEPLNTAEPFEPEHDDDSDRFKRRRDGRHRALLAVIVALLAVVVWIVVMAMVNQW